MGSVLVCQAGKKLADPPFRRCISVAQGTGFSEKCFSYDCVCPMQVNRLIFSLYVFEIPIHGFSLWNGLPREAGADPLRRFTSRRSQRCDRSVKVPELFFAACMSTRAKIINGKGAT